MQMIRQLNNSNTHTLQNNSSELKSKPTHFDKPSELLVAIPTDHETQIDKVNVTNKLSEIDSKMDPSNEGGIDSINKIEVYEQLKNLNVNKDQLINLLRQEDPMSQQQEDWL